MIKTSKRPDQRRTMKLEAKQARRDDMKVREHKLMMSRARSSKSELPVRMTFSPLLPGADDLRPDRFLHSHARQMRALRRVLAA